ncbi:tryptophan--tRNA ligase [Pseudenhygromyxa sp. WMMC2535]|uniref:tryptophan--tRNA ligase n=1 Tax=Pseudenhygromyxa sp. WMMC2535 TaxID=2712867 RepID=UPI001557F158|nr:tryptophan--tRNA ligase [Pseudenhygromyxa sp. WMMC2535]NVB40638.1 tryptophan--tRNA ligase [Pseudenhygromyxa sp. WMMC2535]
MPDANVETVRDPQPQRVLSGIQPSGVIHLGNYFGAIAQHMALQHEFPGECFYFIADYHALTTVRDAEALRSNVFDVALTYLACGLDPDKALLFRQSDIPEVTELTWLLATVTNMGLLERAVSFKDKAEAGIKRSTGLFFYPVLMAADILLYQSTMVPVGKDQIQHVEMTQDMATYFNEAYAKGAEQPLLRRPEYRLSKAPYVPGVDGRKMSKSYGNTLPLFASGKQLKKAVGAVVTDSTALGEPLTVEGNNVYALLELFCEADELAEIRGYFEAGRRGDDPFGYGHAKQLLAAKISEHFADARERREHYQAHPEEVEAVLQRSAERARAIARETLDACKRACGLL